MNETLTRRCVDSASLAAFEIYKNTHPVHHDEEMPPLEETESRTDGYTDDDYDLIRARLARGNMLHQLFNSRRTKN